MRVSQDVFVRSRRPIEDLSHVLLQHTLWMDVLPCVGCAAYGAPCFSNDVDRNWFIGFVQIQSQTTREIPTTGWCDATDNAIYLSKLD